MTSCRFSRWRISAVLDFRGPIMASLKSPCTTFYRSSMNTIAINCLVYEKIPLLYFGDRQTDKQTDSQTDRQTDAQIDALSRSRCRERRLNNNILMGTNSYQQYTLVCYKRIFVSDVIQWRLLLPPPTKAEVMWSFILSFVLLLCKQDNWRTRKRTSTKLGRLGQGVTL